MINETALLFGLQAGGLLGIHGLSGNNITAVGTCNDSKAISGFIGRSDGTHWTNVTPGDIRPLHTVWMRGVNDIFAGDHSGYVLHYKGVKCQSVPPGTTLDVWRIFCLPTGEVCGVASDYWNSPQASLILRIDSSQITTEQVISGRRMFALRGDSKTISMWWMRVYFIRVRKRAGSNCRYRCLMSLCMGLMVSRIRIYSSEDFSGRFCIGTVRRGNSRTLSIINPGRPRYTKYVQTGILIPC